MKHITRRGFIKTVGVGAGALAGTRLAGNGLIGSALAASPEPTTLVVVYFNGGINAIFTGADAFTGTAFGVTANNFTMLPGGVAVDNALAGAIPQGFARDHVASIGIRHGTTDHGTAQRSLFRAGANSAPLQLAAEIGGTGAIKAAVVGGNSLPSGQNPAPFGGVSLQAVGDMRAAIESVAGATPAANVVDREGGAKGVEASKGMSKALFEKNKASLSSVDQGLDATLATLKKPVQPFNVQEFNTAYGLNGTAVNNFAARMAAAELMARSGANFVFASDGGWDTHGDRNGNTVRNMVTQRIANPLRTFITRMIQNEAARSERNVMVAIVGDFHRSLPGSDHQGNVSALVIGKHVRSGTTGKTGANVALPGATPGIMGFWQYVGALSKTGTNPFGANPHPLVL